MRNLRQYLQEKQLKNLHSSFIKPYTEYNTLARSSAPKTYLTKIDISIRKSTRTIIFKEKHDSLKPYYKYLNKNPFEYQIKTLQRKFMWKLLNDEQPKIIRGKSPLQEAQQSTITIITNSQYPSTDLQ